MCNRNFFIGREAELAKLWANSCMEEDSFKIFCIQADGGIGKTRLLQEFYSEYNTNREHIFISPIIDFDDHTLHIVRHLKYYIAENIALQHYFKEYLEEMETYQSMKKANINPSQLRKQNQKVQTTWIKCFNQVSSKKKVVLLFDTMDAFLDDQDNLDEIIEQLFIKELKNTTLILAGRNAENIKVQISKKSEKIFVETIILHPLEKKNAEKYIEEKENKLALNFSKDVKGKILFLSKKIPILIDLAVEYLSRNHNSSQWLSEINISELQKPDKLESYQKYFENQLVKGFAQERRHLDWLTLLLAHVYPLDPPIIESLLELDKETAEELFEQAKLLVFIKTLPDGCISLHDEMRRMVKKYVWEEIDTDKNKRRKYSEIALPYWKNKFKSLSDKLKEEQNTKCPNNLDGFIRIENIKRKILSLKLQNLRHSLFINIDITKTFTSLFDGAEKSSDFTLQGAILNLINPYVNELSGYDLYYEISKRKIRYLRNKGNYKVAKEEIEVLLVKAQDLPAKHEVEMLIEYGNIEVREGNLQQAFYDFGKALKLTEKHQLEEEKFKVLNVVGWIYRLLGDIEQAIHYYIEALDYAAEKGANIASTGILARLHNNLGYVYALERDRDSARRMCHHALELWKQDHYKRGEGIVHSTLGRICIEFDEYDTAIEEFDQALEIINSQDDEWLSKIYLGRSQAFRLRSYQAELNAQALSEEAQILEYESEDVQKKQRRASYYTKSQKDLTASKNDLHKVKQIDCVRDQQEYYYRFAIIYLSEKNGVEAKKYFEKGYDISKETYDLHYQLMNLSGIAKICSRNCDVSQLQRFRDEVNTFSNTSQISIFNFFKKKETFKNIEDSNLKQQVNQHPLPIALLKRYLGDMALYENRIDEAVDLYTEAFPIIAKHGRHEPLTITGQLKDIQYFVFPYLNNKTIQNLAQKLQLFWRQTTIVEPLKRRYPEALLTFGRWENGVYDQWDTNLKEQIDE